MKLWGALLVLLMSGCATDWTRADTNRQLLLTGLMAVDAYQTTRIQYDPGLIEGVPLTRSVLGSNPSTAPTYQYFAELALSHYLIARVLPAKWRPYYQGFFVLDHLYGIHTNIRLGL